MLTVTVSWSHLVLPCSCVICVGCGTKFWVSCQVQMMPRDYQCDVHSSMLIEWALFPVLLFCTCNPCCDITCFCLIYYLLTSALCSGLAFTYRMLQLSTYVCLCSDGSPILILQSQVGLIWSHLPFNDSFFHLALAALISFALLTLSHWSLT